MNFEDILNQWEQSQSQNKRKSSKVSANWLDKFPPDKEALEEKNRECPAPQTEGRSIWLKRPHQDSVDLHGLTEKDARHTLTYFIQQMRRRGLRKGLVIHGKGIHSAKDPVLATMVRNYLEESAEVGEFGEAKRLDGGSGATWFLLRQRSR